MDGNEWMKDLRSKAEHYQEPEPDGLWEDIRASVCHRRHVSRRRPVALVPFLAATAAAVIAFLYLHYHLHDNAHVSPEGNPSLVADARILSSDLAGSPDVEMAYAGTVPSGKSGASGCGLVPDGRFSSEGSSASCGNGMPDEDSLSGQTEKVPEEVPEEHGPRHGDDRMPVTRRPMPAACHGEEVEYVNRITRISAKVYYSDLPGSSSGGSGFGSLVSPSAALDRSQAMSIVNAGDVDGSALLAVDDQLSTEVRHRQPVRAGVSVRFDLPGRWGLETGLTYSLLESESDAGTSYRYFHTERRFHYLGIPLKVTFDAVRKRHWSLYLSAGGMLEKNVAGKADVDFIVDGVRVSARKENMRIRQLQWSLNAAAGVEYLMIPAMGIYAEPGVSWFIDNGSQIETVYQSRPVNFNLEIGLRFHF